MKLNKGIFITLSLMSLMLLSFSVSSDEIKMSIPSVDVNDLEGNIVSTSTFSNNGKPYVIVIWATWNKPVVLELNELKDPISKLKEERGTKLIAVSIDDVRNKSKVKPFVQGKGWNYEFYIDLSSKFKSALKAENIPMTYVVNSQNEIVWSFEGYSPNDADKILEVLKSTK